MASSVIGKNDPRLGRYAELLLARKQTVNVTGARDESAVWEHIADSLTLAPYVRDPHIDIGSGGGFPAIPLAIVCGVRVTLVESVAKKARFLREVATELGLDATVLSMRAEEAGRDPCHRERYACATARAVAQASTILELTAPLLAIGGVALLQRGKAPEGERGTLADAALMLGMEIGEEIALEGSDDRRIILAHKRTPTPIRFPRRAGVPHKRPLCPFA
jgi:16S rRNA (guanine527-N7)-methyltransferase